MPIVYDIVNSTELQGYISYVSSELDRNVFTLAQLFPNTATVDGGMDYDLVRGRLKQPNAAKFRALDTTTRVGKREGFTASKGRILPISNAMMLNEYDILWSRAKLTGSARGIIDQIFNDQATNTRAIGGRLELARGEELATGKLVIGDNEIAQSVDFGRDVALTTNVAITWNNTATSTPLTDLKGLIATYRSKNNEREPGAIIMGKQVRDFMRLSQQFKDLSSVGAMIPSTLTPGIVESILTSHEIPPIFTYDTVVPVDGVDTRVIPANMIILIPPAGVKFGETLYGVTAEARVGIDAQQLSYEGAQGLTGTVHREDNPVQVFSKVTGVVLPILGDANLTMACRVLP